MIRPLKFFLLCLLFLHQFGIVSAAGIAEREVLPNGVVLLHAERKALPMVKVVVALKSGSIVEPPGKAGLSNLTAALLNERTAGRSARDISEAIEFVGGSLGVSGGSDYITVTLSVLKKDIALGFDLLSDIILRPAFREEEIIRQKTIIKNTIIRNKEEPSVIASKAFMNAVYGNHPYGRPVEGTEESLDGITRQDIVDFHSAYYAPNNAIFAVAGDIDRGRLLTLFDTYFKHWQHKEPSALPPTHAGKLKGIHRVAISRDLTQATVILGHHGIRRDNPDYYAVSVMNYILGGGGFASRLMDNIRDTRGLSYNVSSSFSAGKYGGSFSAGLQTKNEAAHIAIGEILKEMERIRTDLVTDGELADAKAYLTGSFPMRLDSNSKLTGFLVAVEFYGLGLAYADEYKNFINAVSKQDILRVAQQYLNIDDYILVVVGDLKKTSLAR